MDLNTRNGRAEALFLQHQRRGFTPAASAKILPQSAVWISTAGLTLADGGTTIDSWLAGWGGIRPTITAPAATNRPAYTAGVVPTLTFDGVDNVLGGVMTKGSLWTDAEVGGVFSRVAFGTAGDTMLGYAIPNTVVFRIDDGSASTIRGIHQGGAAFPSSTTDPDGVMRHWSTDQIEGLLTIRNTGTIEASNALTFTNRADGGQFALGGNHLAMIAYGNLQVVAAYAGPILNADQRLYLRQLLTHHTGVTS